MGRSKRILAVAAALALATAGAACGQHEETKEGLTEGANLDIGEMTYQVQISRQLNPRDTEDSAYLEGVPPAERRLDRTETWFGVFMRVQNDSDEPQIAANRFEILDTEEDIYVPLRLAPANQWAYRGGLVAPGVGPPATDDGLIPRPNTPPADGVIQGSLLLFKLPLDALNNRPLELKIALGLDSAVVDLDI